MNQATLEERFPEVHGRYVDAHSLHQELVHQGKMDYLKSAGIKVLLIILGAVTAAQGAVTDLWSSTVVTWIYIVVGVVTATAAGLLAAFKWEERSTKAKALVPRAHNLEHQAQTDLQRLRDSQMVREQAEEALGKGMFELENEAAKLGVVLKADKLPTRKERKALADKAMKESAESVM